MPWTPLFPQMDFGEPIFENLKRIIKRDQTAALAWANGGAGLEDFARILSCERVSKEFPALAIIPRGDDPKLIEDGHVDQTLDVLMEIAITSRKPEAMELELRRRVRAIRMIVMTATVLTPQDVLLNVGANHSSVSLEIGQAVYEQARDNAEVSGLYYRSAYALFTFEFSQGG